MKRDKAITIRLTEKELAILRELASISNLSLTSFIINSCLKEKHKVKKKES